VIDSDPPKTKRAICPCQATRDGVVHMAFHPRLDAMILAAGDKGGRVGLWQLDHQSFEVDSVLNGLL